MSDQANTTRRTFVLGQIEQILRTSDPQGPGQFFENVQSTRLDLLAQFLGPFHPHDFRTLSIHDCQIVVDWLLFRCGVSDRNPDRTIPEHLADDFEHGEVTALLKAHRAEQDYDPLPVDAGGIE